MTIKVPMVINMIFVGNTNFKHYIIKCVHIIITLFHQTISKVLIQTYIHLKVSILRWTMPVHKPWFTATSTCWSTSSIHTNSRQGWFQVNSKSILFCTTTGHFLPFSLPSYKKREEEKENKVAKPVLNHFFQ